jgi:lipoic acid synthetase
VETVRRLTPRWRDRRAGYEQSLAVLAVLSERTEKRKVKSGLMVGLGETRREILETLADLRDVGVDIVTIGQYLRPNQRAAPVERYVPPAEFDEIAAEAEALGFGAVVAGPLVRSSYHALKAYAESCAS